MEELTNRISVQVWRVDSLIFGVIMLASVFFFLCSSDAVPSNQRIGSSNLSGRSEGFIFNALHRYPLVGFELNVSSARNENNQDFRFVSVFVR
jgi:hypothetical protein